METKVKVLSAQEMKDLSVLAAGKLEQLAWTLYDIQAYAQAGVASLTFFKTSLSGSVTPSNTDMELAGQLPSNNSFVLKRLTLSVIPGVDCSDEDYVKDQQKVLNVGNLVLSIGSKPYRKLAPLSEAADGGLEGFAATTAKEIHYAASRSRVACIFDPWLLIPPTLNFDVTVAFPEGLQAISAAGRMKVSLHGYLLRPLQ